MPTTLKETEKQSDAAETAGGEHSPDNGEPGRKAKWCMDHDPALYPEAVVPVLTPKRRRTRVTAETFAAARAGGDKP